MFINDLVEDNLSITSHPLSRPHFISSPSSVSYIADPFSDVDGLASLASTSPVFGSVLYLGRNIKSSHNRGGFQKHIKSSPD